MSKNNIAYIDGANLHRGISTAGWELDYAKLRVWLTDKFSVSEAYIFLGNIPKYNNLYTYFQECGYKLIFKEVVYDNNGKPKGNCDADLVLKATQDFYNNKFDEMLLVSSDGDYTALVNFAIAEKRFCGVLSPSNEKRCSVLLKRTSAKIFYIQDQANLLKK